MPHPGRLRDVVHTALALIKASWVGSKPSLHAVCGHVPRVECEVATVEPDVTAAKADADADASEEEEKSGSGAPVAKSGGKEKGVQKRKKGGENKSGDAGKGGGKSKTKPKAKKAKVPSALSGPINETYNIMATGETGTLMLTGVHVSNSTKAPGKSHAFSVTIMAAGAAQIGWALCSANFDDGEDLQTARGCCVYDGFGISQGAGSATVPPLAGGAAWREGDVVTSTLTLRDDQTWEVAFTRNGSTPPDRVTLPSAFFNGNNGGAWGYGATGDIGLRPVVSFPRSDAPFERFTNGSRAMYESVVEQLYFPTLYRTPRPSAKAVLQKNTADEGLTAMESITKALAAKARALEKRLSDGSGSDAAAQATSSPAATNDSYGWKWDKLAPGLVVADDGRLKKEKQKDDPESKSPSAFGFGSRPMHYPSNALGSRVMQSGRHRWDIEVEQDAQGAEGDVRIGITTADCKLTSALEDAASHCFWHATTGKILQNVGRKTSGDNRGFKMGDVVNIELDADQGKISFGKNGTAVRSVSGLPTNVKWLPVVGLDMVGGCVNLLKDSQARLVSRSVALEDEKVPRMSVQGMLPLISQCKALTSDKGHTVALSDDQASVLASAAQASRDFSLAFWAHLDEVQAEGQPAQSLSPGGDGSVASPTMTSKGSSNSLASKSSSGSLSALSASPAGTGSASTAAQPPLSSKLSMLLKGTDKAKERMPAIFLDATDW